MVKIAAMGDNVVDCYASRGEMFPGGNCLNVAVYVSRFGAQSAYIGAIGKDHGRRSYLRRRSRPSGWTPAICGDLTVRPPIA